MQCSDFIKEKKKSTKTGVSATTTTKQSDDNTIEIDLQNDLINTKKPHK